MDEFITIWQNVVDIAVFWWRKKHTLNIPRVISTNNGDVIDKYYLKIDKDYRTYQRDALYYLRSEIPNKDNLSVIQLAAARGLVRVVREMIWVDNVFVKRSETGDKYANVTKLMPHLKGGENIKYKKEGCWVSYGDLQRNQNETYGMVENDQSQRDEIKHGALGECDTCTKSDSPGYCGCLLNTVLEMEHSNKANEIFKIEPMKQLVRDHWFVHQWWTVFMLLAYLLYMALYGSYSLSNIYTIYATNKTNADELQINQACITWPIILVAPDMIIWIILPIGSLVKKKRQAWIRYVKKLVIEDVNIDVKDTFNWPSVLLSVLVLLITLTMPLIFCLTTVIGLQFLNINHDVYAYFTTVSIVLGWLLTAYWGGAFEPVYRFLRALRSILLKDVISFLFFYIFVLLAFSNAIYAIMTWVPSLMEQYDDLNDVMYE